MLKLRYPKRYLKMPSYNTWVHVLYQYVLTPGKKSLLPGYMSCINMY